MHVNLTVIDGPQKGKKFEFREPDNFLLGRDNAGSNAHFRLNNVDNQVSRNHFLLEVNPPDCYIRDAGSLNGTFIVRPGNKRVFFMAGRNDSKNEYESRGEKLKDKLAYIYAGKVREYALVAIPELSAHKAQELADLFAGKVLAEKLTRAVGLLEKVIDQTDRRVFKGETVPASEKVVSFFEDHTDIIVKKRRETEYEHKIFLTGGVSTLILDCLIVRGNPADTDKYGTMLERQKDLYGRMPRQVSADGGFASKDNLAFAKQNQVKDAAFAKKRGLSVLDMAKSAWVYKALRNFRAGIEAGISVLKRAFGLDRCTWKGWEGFGRYVWSSVVSYNLLVLARTKLA